MVAGDRAARPEVPTVRPTKALSMLDRRGAERNIPSAGIANVNIPRFDVVDADIVSVFVLSLSSFFSLYKLLFLDERETEFSLFR